MEAIELFNQGKLGEAIAAAIAAVKAAPSDVDSRGLLSDLLCFSADPERADKHLETIATLQPGAATGVSLVRQLLRAQAWREDFYREGRTPEFLKTPDEALQLQLRASIALREGESAEAQDLLGQAEELRGPLRCARVDPEGSGDATTYDEFRDCDDLVGGALEVFTSTGKFYWIPISQVKELEPRPRERVRDLLWRRVRLEVDDGPEGEVYLPSIYAPMEADADDATRLGRLTEYTESEPVRGIGRRQFLLGDEAVTVDELPFLRFEA